MEKEFKEELGKLTTRLKVIETVLNELKKLDKESQRDVLALAAEELGIEEPIIRHDVLTETIKTKK